MKVATPELLLALRAPNSGWLAAMICALDEALRDPDFNAHQRALVRNLLDAGDVPASVSAAATERLQRFEQTVQEMHAAMFGPDTLETQPVTTRPKLTLCGSAA